MKRKLNFRVHLHPVLQKLTNELKIAFVLITICIFGSMVNSVYAAWDDLQQTVVTGKVTDSKGEALPGVNVLLKGTVMGSMTDVSGKYSITVPDLNGTLAFSFIGYTTLEVPVAGRRTVDVQLIEETTSLGEVVVTALGIKREAKRVGYATTSVDNDYLTAVRTTNFGNSLQGKVAGLNISQPAGGPGGSSKILLTRMACQWVMMKIPLSMILYTPGNQALHGNILS